MKHITVAIAALVLAACGGDSEPSRMPPVPTPSQADPLLGTWDSGRVPMRRIRAAIRSAGYTNTERAAFLREFGIDGTAYRFRLAFYREGTLPFVAQRHWDPDRGAAPVDADHGPYELQPRHRVAITSADPQIHRYRWVFSYRVRDGKLHLTVVSSTNPGLGERRLRLENALLYALAAAPLKKE